MEVGIFLYWNRGTYEPESYLLSAAAACGERVMFQHRHLMRIAVPLMHDLINARPRSGISRLENIQSHGDLSVFTRR